MTSSETHGDRAIGGLIRVTQQPARVGWKHNQACMISSSWDTKHLPSSCTGVTITSMDKKAGLWSQIGYDWKLQQLAQWLWILTPLKAYFVAAWRTDMSSFCQELAYKDIQWKTTPPPKLRSTTPNTATKPTEGHLWCSSSLSQQSEEKTRIRKEHVTGKHTRILIKIE